MRSVILAVTVALAGCAAPMTGKMERLSLGMTKAQAIEIMGRPASVAATDGVEYLTYRLSTSVLDTDGSDTSDYFVRVVDGKVDAYGKKGDFDTTAKPKDRLEIEVKTK